MLDRNQFESLIRRTLIELDPRLCTDEAVNLILGTAAVESRFGTYLRQLGNGPARGFFQIEENTFHWLRNKYSKRYPQIANYDFKDLEWNIKAGIIYCRLRYLVDPVAIPSKLNLQAQYWKRVYNTRYGKGTFHDFINAWYVYVEGRRNVD